MPLSYEFRYALRLLSVGPDRLRTMAALRQLRPDLSLKEAKALLDTIPCVVLSNISMKEKEEAKRPFIRIADTDFVSEW